MDLKTKSIDAFQGNLDCRPIYLGYCKKESSYWFYTLKDKIPRFLKYISYFHWDRGPQEVLEMKPLPEEVESELQQFLEGKFGYEFRKRRKNSKEISAFKIFQLPGEIGEETREQYETLRVAEGSIVPNVKSPGSSYIGGSLSGPTSTEREDDTNALCGGGSPRRSGYAVSTEYSSTGILPAPILAEIKTPLLEHIPVTPEPKRRGRPRKIQVIEKSSSIVSSDIVELVSQEQPNVEAKCKLRKPKSKPENGLVMGGVELLKAFEILLPVEPEVTIRKKRGRPLKVKP